jgi:hypothetical protein
MQFSKLVNSSWWSKEISGRICKNMWRICRSTHYLAMQRLGRLLLELTATEYRGRSKFPFIKFRSTGLVEFAAFTGSLPSLNLLHLLSWLHLLDSLNPYTCWICCICWVFKTCRTRWTPTLAKFAASAGLFKPAGLDEPPTLAEFAASAGLAKPAGHAETPYIGWICCICWVS